MMSMHLQQATLLESVKDLLVENGYEVLIVERKAFDIIAKKQHQLFLIKILLNVDSYSENQAKDMKTTAALINAKPMIISLHGRNFVIEDNVIYERFSIPVMNPSTFRRFIEENYLPEVVCRKGKKTVSIDREKMRIARKSRELSMNDLARMVGVTKKTIYLMEKEGKGSEEIVTRVERVLQECITMPVNISEWKIEPEKRDDVEGIEKTVTSALHSRGFECYTLRCAPPTLINLHESKKVIAGKVSESRPTSKSVEEFKLFSDFCSLSKFLVLRESKTHRFYGIVVFNLSELEELPEGQELIKIIKEKEESE
jgi:putative transcriptional regulator